MVALLALNALAASTGEDAAVLLTTILGAAQGATDARSNNTNTTNGIIALDVGSDKNRDGILNTLGHELNHAAGSTSEVASDLMGTASNLLVEVATDANRTQVNAAKGNLVNATAQQNAAVLEAGNAGFLDALADNPNGFDYRQLEKRAVNIPGMGYIKEIDLAARLYKDSKTKGLPFTATQIAQALRSTGNSQFNQDMMANTSVDAIPFDPSDITDKDAYNGVRVQNDMLILALPTEVSPALAAYLVDVTGGGKSPYVDLKAQVVRQEAAKQEAATRVSTAIWGKDVMPASELAARNALIMQNPSLFSFVNTGGNKTAYQQQQDVKLVKGMGTLLDVALIVCPVCTVIKNVSYVKDGIEIAVADNKGQEIVAKVFGEVGQLYVINKLGQRVVNGELTELQSNQLAELAGMMTEDAALKTQQGIKTSK